MALEFVNDAISLSGLTGSRLKCEVIGQYYPFWWNITSGGPRANHQWPTAIVELDAATGEVYIEETNETILGSSGHALNLKCSSQNTQNLKVVLIERDADCYKHLKQVMAKRWGNIDIGLAEGLKTNNRSNIYMLNAELEDAVNTIDKLNLGNALFFFDPLRSTEYQTIEKVASKRIKTYYKKGTEFIIFVFTSDWFLGRDDFSGLPITVDGTVWSAEQRRTVSEADALFGDKEWHELILRDDPIDVRENSLIELYRDRLHRWFRYILPMPFNPKEKQIFHLILCSNFEIGVRATRNFYCGITHNLEYAPDNTIAFNKFKTLHPVVFQGLGRNKRPTQWRILWCTITGHEEGICDYLCSDVADIEPNEAKRQESLEWLETEGYIEQQNSVAAWKLPIKQYKLNWPKIKDKLGIDPPPALKPLSLKPLSLKEISQ